MRKVLFLLFSYFVFCFSVYAHRPLAINIEPDFKNSKLKIVIVHPVTNPHKRYIRKVEITVDEGDPIVRWFSFQIADKRVLTVDVPDLQEAEKVVIKAYCNRGGMREEEFNLSDFRKSEGTGSGEEE